MIYYDLIDNPDKIQEMKEILDSSHQFEDFEGFIRFNANKTVDVNSSLTSKQLLLIAQVINMLENKAEEMNTPESFDHNR